MQLIQVGLLKERIQQLTAELNREKKDKEALKSQSEGLHREFDRLTEAYSKLHSESSDDANRKRGKGKDD